jgi:hypothetical protein
MITGIAQQGPTPLEERFYELDYLMYEHRTVGNNEDYLRLHLEKETIRRYLDND